MKIVGMVRKRTVNSVAQCVNARGCQHFVNDGTILRAYAIDAVLVFLHRTHDVLCACVLAMMRDVFVATYAHVFSGHFVYHTLLIRRRSVIAGCKIRAK